MAVPIIHAFVTFNGGSPLPLTQRSNIPVAAFKAIHFFTGETSVTPTEHIQDVASIYSIFDIIEDKLAVRLIASSFKGKALQ